MQQSPLTYPPAVAFADIAVRYVATARRPEVGRDWYYVFRRRTGELMLVIGGVSGTTPGQPPRWVRLRGLLRGIGFTTADDPSRVLSGVDEAVQSLLGLATLAALATARGCRALSTGGRGGRRPAALVERRPLFPVLLGTDGKARVLTPSRGKADLC